MPDLTVSPTAPVVPGQLSFLYLARSTGTITVGSGHSLWESFTPLADGLPVLEDGVVLRAQCQGNTLAAICHTPATGLAPRLRLFRGPEGVPLGEWELPERYSNRLALSSDGRRVAYQQAPTEVVVVDVGSGARFATGKGKCHPDVQLELGDCWLAAGAGGRKHWLSWKQGRLEHRYQRIPVVLPYSHGLPAIHVPPGAGFAVREKSLPGLDYDANRFLKGVASWVTVVVDTCGQLVVFDRNRQLVCMFFVFRDNLAGWLPDGTRCGPPHLTGGPDSPEARDKIGRALLTAWERGREMRP